MKDAMLSHCKEIAPNENEKAKHQKELKDFERKILDSGLSTEEQGEILDILTAGSTFATTNSFKAITATLPRQESENDGLEIKRAAELAKKAEEDRLEELRINEARIIAEQEAAKIEQQKKAAELAKKIEEDRLEQLRIEKKLATKEAEDRVAEEKAKEKAEKLEQQKVLEEKTSIDKEMLDAKKAIEREIEKAIKETGDLLPVIEQSNNKEIILENGQILPSISIAEWVVIAREAIEDSAYRTDHLSCISCYASKAVVRIREIVEQGSALSNLRTETIIPVSTIGAGKFETFKQHLPDSFIGKFILFSNILNECKDSSDNSDKEINDLTKRINKTKGELVNKVLENTSFKETNQYECRINDLKAWYFEINSYESISSECSRKAQSVLKQLLNLLEGFNQVASGLDHQDVVGIENPGITDSGEEGSKELQMKKNDSAGGRTEEESKAVEPKIESLDLYGFRILLKKSKSEGPIVTTKSAIVFGQENQDKSGALKKVQSYEDFTAMLGNPQGDF